MTLTVERTYSTYNPRSATAGIAVPVLSSNFAQLLWDSAAKRPGQRVIVERDSETSYAELRIRAGRVAGALSAGGIKPGDRVTISRGKLGGYLLSSDSGATMRVRRLQ